MDIKNKIIDLERSIKNTDLLVDEMVSYLEKQKIKTILKEKKISKLKEEVAINVKKIDEIIENYYGNT
jgi:GTP-binding protein EngB required for normal cell division